MMQHEMLQPMHEEFMLEEIIEPRVQRDIKGDQPEPERDATRHRHARMPRAAREQNRRDEHGDDDRRRRLPRIEPVEKRAHRQASFAWITRLRSFAMASMESWSVASRRA